MSTKYWTIEWATKLTSLSGCLSYFLILKQNQILFIKIQFIIFRNIYFCRCVNQLSNYFCCFDWGTSSECNKTNTSQFVEFLYILKYLLLFLDNETEIFTQRFSNSPLWLSSLFSKTQKTIFILTFSTARWIIKQNL